MSVLLLNKAAEEAYKDYLNTHRGIADSAMGVATKYLLPLDTVLSQVSKLYPNMRTTIALLTNGKVDHTI